jgi:hypothetical protein
MTRRVNPDFLKRAKAIRKNLAERNLGRPLTSLEEAVMEVKVDRRVREHNRSRASRWAREGGSRDADD